MTTLKSKPSKSSRRVLEETADVDLEESTEKEVTDLSEATENPENLGSPERRRRELRKLVTRLLSKPNPLRPSKLLPPREKAEEEEAERVKNDLFNLNHLSIFLMKLYDY